MQEVEQLVRTIEMESAENKPLSLCLAEAVERLIDSGVLQSGTLLPPTRRLAELTGVSVQVAQEACTRLSERGRVERKRRAGTVVIGRTPTRILGLLTAVDPSIPPLANPGWIIAQTFMHSIEQRDYRFRHYLVRIDSSGQPALPENLIHDLKSLTLDVLLVGAVYQEIAFPYVPPTIPVYHLTPDESGLAESLEDAARWLWRLNVQRPAIVLEAADRAPFIEAAFSAACSAFRMPLAPDRIVRNAPSRIAFGKTVYRQLMDKGDRPDGLVIMDDMVGYGLLQELGPHDRLDPTRIVVMTNRGSSLHIDSRCPQIQIDWGVVVEKTLAKALGEPSLREDQQPVYRFVPP